MIFSLLFLIQICHGFIIRPFSSQFSLFSMKSTALQAQLEDDIDNSQHYVMINGLPGNMALETAISCVNRGYNIIPIGFTGKSGKLSDIDIIGNTKTINVKLLKGPGLSDTAINDLKLIKKDYPNLLIVDYTHPSATFNNVQAYIDCNCDFVMGTTGGNEEELLKMINLSTIHSITAPNRAKQIVALQSGLLEVSKRFPGAFDGYKLTVRKSSIYLFSLLLIKSILFH